MINDLRKKKNPGFFTTLLSKISSCVFWEHFEEKQIWVIVQKETVSWKLPVLWKPCETEPFNLLLINFGKMIWLAMYCMKLAVQYTLTQSTLAHLHSKIFIFQEVFFFKHCKIVSWYFIIRILVTFCVLWKLGWGGGGGVSPGVKVPQLWKYTNCDKNMDD
jgi:hypothetical protein